jgi:hypothetical protein
MADEPKGASAKAEEKIGKEMAELMPLSQPLDVDLEFYEREPDKVIPSKGDDGADTPSGAALMKVGAPSKDPEELGSEGERVRGLKYRVEKYKKRWLG